MLVAGLSVRALAQAAGAAGYSVLAADLFGDLDLEAAAADTRRVAGNLDAGLDEDSLVEALDDLSRGRRPDGLVYGAGFEDRPALIERLAARWPLLGNGAEAVSRAKNPRTLAGLCSERGIPHPEMRIERPETGNWLAKRVGGSGGTHVGEGHDAGVTCPPGDRFAAGHVRPALSPGGGREYGRGCHAPVRSPESHIKPAIYWQRRIGGEAISALILADGARARLLGLTNQWTSPAPHTPFRYGGAVRPATVEARTSGALQRTAVAVVAGLGLKGLNSVDFLVGAGAWWLLEVNPRPGATLDVFRHPSGQFFRLHVEACQGVLPDETIAFEGAEAAALVYAREPIRSMPAIDWPDWTADRQRPATSVKAGAPLCTVLASAGTPDEARRIAEERVTNIQNRIEKLS